MVRHRPATRRRLLGATAILLGSLTMVTATASPAAADGDEPDGYATFVFAQWNGGSDSGSGTFGVLPDCGPININGRKDFAKWSVGSSVADGAEIEVGDEIELTATVFSRLTSNGNNGPDPLHVNLPITGPIQQAAPSEGTFPAGNFAHAGNDSTGPLGPLGPYGWSYDVNSDPSIIWPGDGAYVDLTIRVRATAPGQINLPRLEVAGFDETPSPGNFYCEIPINLNWTVDDVDPPTSGPDSATTDASYSLTGLGGTIDDAAGGAHAIDIDVHANDDDPEVAGGPGDAAQVRIFDWSTVSDEGGTVSCGSPGEKAQASFAAQGDGPCRYTPPQDVIGVDRFRYTMQSVSGVRRTVTVTVQLRPNPAPFVSPVEFAANDEAAGVVFDLQDAVSDFAGDTDFFCTPDGAAVAFTNDIGTGTLSGECLLTFTANDTPVERTGTFTYRVCDRHPLLTDFGPIATAVAGYDQGSPDDLTATTNSRCRDASASIRITPVNGNFIALPVAVPDTDVVDANYADTSSFSLRLPVLDNDYDVNDPEFPDVIGGFDLLPGTLDPVTEGTAVFVNNGETDTYEIIFTPAIGVEGEVTFQYRVGEVPAAQNPPGDPGLPIAAVGTVTIFVIPNDPPLTEPDAVLTSSITPITDFDAGVNDTDPQGDTIECTPGNLPAEPVGLVAAATIDAACLVDITPVVGAAGVAELTYEACDVHALADPDDPNTPYGSAGETTDDLTSRCTTKVISATIVAPAVDDPGLLDFDPDPACVADTATTTAGTAVDIAVLTNDSDLDLANAASPLTVSGAGIVDNEDVSASGGVVLASADEQRVRYTPPAGFTGTDTFTYAAQDTAGQGCAAAVTVTVTAVAGSGVTQPPGGALARTGGVPGGIGQLQLGLGLALLGFGLVLLGSDPRLRFRRVRA